VLQCVAVCCSVLQRVAVCCSVLQCVAVCCGVLQCVAVSVPPLVRYRQSTKLSRSRVLATHVISVMQRIAACCSVLQRVAAYCSLLQYVACVLQTKCTASNEYNECNMLNEYEADLNLVEDQVRIYIINDFPPLK